jgi:hypothetical protein
MNTQEPEVGTKLKKIGTPAISEIRHWAFFLFDMVENIVGLKASDYNIKLDTGSDFNIRLDTISTFMSNSNRYRTEPKSE